MAPPSLLVLDDHEIAHGDCRVSPRQRAKYDQVFAFENERRFAVQFGGQGIAFWPELQRAVTEAKLSSKSIRVDRLVQQSAKALLEESCASTMDQPIELLKWLELDIDAQPSDKLLERAPVSMPLVFLSQMINYLVFLGNCALEHEDMRHFADCAMGFSQGAVSAVVFATSTTEESLVENAVRFLRVLFWQGFHAEEVFGERMVDAGKNNVLSAKQMQRATPMLVIDGLNVQQVKDFIRLAQQTTRSCESLQIAEVCGPFQVCVSGFASDATKLEKFIESRCVSNQEDQSRVPFSNRKPTATLNFARVSCAFHSDLLATALPRIMHHVHRLAVTCTGHSLALPVHVCSQAPMNLQTLGNEDLMVSLIEMQLTKSIDWPSTWNSVVHHHPRLTDVLDFGPEFGVAKLSAPLAEPHGVGVVIATSRYDSYTNKSTLEAPLTGIAQFASTTRDRKKSTWEECFKPCVVNGEYGVQQLSNRFTRVMKKPPVMIGGMTPTTSLNGVDLVAAALNAGFHAELAAGGLSTPELFKSKMQELVSKLEPGIGISLNLLYLNVEQWSFQFPMVIRMRERGWPIESITIAAGIPSLDRALEILGRLMSVGISVVAFKPGSLASVYEVLEIAKAMPTMTIMIQWTGGRAGGHHSFEDFHLPLQTAYASIRRLPNVLLVVGSGFGDWEDSHQYLTGAWSRARGALTGMPVDGILVASRVMVAKEAATAQAVKEMIVATPGITEECEWEHSYHSIAGGIITVSSELGEPIHKVANRGMLCWRDFDERYFSKSREEMELAVRLDKDAIIERLNRDFQKPFFGCTRRHGSNVLVPVDLEEMTYEEVLVRMVDLMFVEGSESYKMKKSRWVHESYRSRFLAFLGQAEQRFAGQNASAFGGISVENETLNNSPRDLLARFSQCYPRCQQTLMSVVDVDFFVHLCRNGGKPVNFIPVIDGDLRYWFKKDSLWYSEDLDAVPDQDPGRVCILQGPMAVRYSKVTNEPVATILEGIVNGFIRVILEGQTSTPSCMSRGKSILPENCASVATTSSLIGSIVEISSRTDWLNVLVMSEYVTRGKMWVPNPIKAMLKRIPQSSATRMGAGSGKELIEIVDESLGQSYPVLRIAAHTTEQDPSAVDICVAWQDTRPKTNDNAEKVVPLEFHFTYYPLRSGVNLVENVDQSLKSIDKYFQELWLGDESDCCNSNHLSIHDTFTNEFVMKSEDIEDFRVAIGLGPSTGHFFSTVPIDFATVAAWKSLIRCFFAKEIHGNLLRSVHLSHAYKLVADSQSVLDGGLFQANDRIVTRCKVTGLRIIESGKAISVRAVVSKELDRVLTDLVEIESEFLIRGEFDDFASTFQQGQSTYRVRVSSAQDAHVIRAAPWISWNSGAIPSLTVGDKLTFRLNHLQTFSSPKCSTTSNVDGHIYREVDGGEVVIGTIELSNQDEEEHPVLAVLNALSAEAETSSILPTNTVDGHYVLEIPWKISVPSDSMAYAQASRDLNPIHRSSLAAELANLPDAQPIVHGMWTAAKVRALLVERMANGVDLNVPAYSVRFDDMVHPGEILFVQLCHNGVRAGRRVLGVEVVNGNGERVMTAQAEVKQHRTAFLFTGQGSAQLGMGMDLFEESSVARHVWERGDSYLREKYGFSILEIVQKNPSSIVIHFGGQRGRSIRANYMELRCEDPSTMTMVALLPEIQRSSHQFVFSAPTGLLFATQFTQLATVLFENAMLAELHSAGLVPDDALFAGHSLGEYASLCGFAKVLALEDILDIVFVRGLIMQKSFGRDARGRSDYGMVAADPSRVGSHFTESMLHEVVDLIAKESDKLLQVVNYNIQDRQYVVAGNLVTLDTLARALSALKAEPSANVKDVVSTALSQAQEKVNETHRKSQHFALTRGVATIPLAGIDVPFHSNLLVPRVPAFRSMLLAKFDACRVGQHLDQLEGRYIPNLTAKPFSMDKEYFEEMLRLTNSPVIAELLRPNKWSRVPKEQQAMTLVVELLAYQFASPVQWIETQRVLFSRGVTRLIEIGPAPILTTIAQRTLQAEQFSKLKCEVLFYQRDRDIVHFECDNSNVSAGEYARSQVKKGSSGEASTAGGKPTDEVSLAKGAQKSCLTVDNSIAPVAASSVPVAQVVPFRVPHVEDVPVSIEHVLKVLVAFRLNRRLAEISLESDVKTLAGGKSAVQNEIVGEFEKEFGSDVPEGAAEVPLKQIAGAIAHYTQLGKVSTALIAKLIASKMPGGFPMSSVKEYLKDSNCLGPSQIQSVLLHGLLFAPEHRFKHESEAHAWLNQVTEDYCKYAGIEIAQPMATPNSAIPASAATHTPALPVVQDDHVQARHALLVLVSTKLHLKMDAVSETATIRDLAAGKSAIQNEIAGDLEKEFGEMPDEVVDVRLHDLADSISGYVKPGRVVNSLVAKQLARTMPAGFGMTAVKEYLAAERMLPPGRIQSVLLHSLIFACDHRLTEEASAQSWLDLVVDDYASFAKITIPRGSQMAGGCFPSTALFTSGDNPSVKKLEQRFRRLLAQQVDAINEYAGKDAFDEHRRASAEVEIREQVESQLRLWQSEHGEQYEHGIRAAFAPKKERQYSSFWNWMVQDAFELYHSICGSCRDNSTSSSPLGQHFNTLSKWIEQRDSSSNSSALDALKLFVRNRATTDLQNVLEFFAEQLEREGFQREARIMRHLAGEVQSGLQENPTYVPHFKSPCPKVRVCSNGAIDYLEQPRPNVTNPVNYVDELSRGLSYDPDRDTSEFQPKLGNFISNDSNRYGVDVNLQRCFLPYAHIRKCFVTDPTLRVYDAGLSGRLLRSMYDMATNGISFSSKVALLTGCGRQSINSEVLCALLEGGATVFVTTSSFGRKTSAFYRRIFEQHGSRGSRLILLPFNQASRADTNQIIDHIYRAHGLDIDFVVPFAALSETGHRLTEIGDRCEVAHRIMLTNTLRLLGEIVEAKKTRGIVTRPALVVLPLSSNLGDFGGDGLYGESKLGLQALMRKWHSEGWQDQLSVVGAVVGWTRGTNLMSGNDLIAEGIEALGIRTFNAAEMGFNLVSLFHPDMVELASDEPVFADFSGNLGQIHDLREQMDRFRAEINEKAMIQRAKCSFTDVEFLDTSQPVAQLKRPDLSQYFCDGLPTLSRVQELAKNCSSQLLHGLLDLEKVVVVTGFGEVGPYGSARTRWEMESFGEFSLEGCIELAWMMGLIQYEHGQWIDTHSREIVPDHLVKAKYEERILEHTGVRVIEPELLEGYEPSKKLFLHQVAIAHNMAPIEVADYEEAVMFQNEHGADNVDIFQDDAGVWMIRLRKGAVINIPKAMRFDRFIAGQVPTGWNAERLGIPKDLANSIDALTLFTLVATVDALVMSGVTDPYEFYQYVHISEVGNCSGGGHGGQRAYKRIYQNRLLGKPMSSDSLQECFINTASAWINMLLLSSSGPIKTPVGACATAAESIEIGVETIKSGKARVVLVGGYDDFGEEAAFEFAQMNVTASSVDELARGRSPREMCRPCSSSREGFVESYGSGMQVLMDAKLALQMGCPIYAVLALTNTATDKTGRSVPAPGQGILTTAREAHRMKQTNGPLLDLAYRRRQFDLEVGFIDQWFALEKHAARGDPIQMAFLEEVRETKLKKAQALWGMDFFHSKPDIAPLRGALSVWNLTVDDIGVVSFHGTGTEFNDRNESEVTQKQLLHLGRKKGNVLPVICQKHLTGHPKAAAGAWMMNGLIQVMHAEVLPGNRNLDNVCDSLRGFDLLTYPNRSIPVKGIKAALMKSFGFGQATGEVLLVHPDLLLATLLPQELEDYNWRRQKRLAKRNTYMQRALTGKNVFVQVKDAPPYSKELESQVYLDPTMRAVYDPKLQSWHFGDASCSSRNDSRTRESCGWSHSPVRCASGATRAKEAIASAMESVMTEAATQTGLGACSHEGIGVDVEPIATFANALEEKQDFIHRNFTDREIEYCSTASDPAASFAGRWAAKEAVVKAISGAALETPNVWKSASAALKEIEVMASPSGAPVVVFSGFAQQVFHRVGLHSISVSISHSGEYALAQALAKCL